MRADFAPRGILDRTLLGATALALGWLASGCVAGHTSDPLLKAELAEAQQRNALERQRVMALEARIADLERESASRMQRERSEARAFENRQVLQKLNELLEVNQRLLREAERARKRDEAPAVAKQEPEEPAPTDLPAAQSREEQLRQIVFEMHGEPGRWRDGLSLEQSEALRVLLKSERPLDLKNPWR